MGGFSHNRDEAEEVVARTEPSPLATIYETPEFQAELKAAVGAAELSTPTREAIEAELKAIADKEAAGISIEQQLEDVFNKIQAAQEVSS